MGIGPSIHIRTYCSITDSAKSLMLQQKKTRNAKVTSHVATAHSNRCIYTSWSHQPGRVTPRHLTDGLCIIQGIRHRTHRRNGVLRCKGQRKGRHVLRTVSGAQCLRVRTLSRRKDNGTGRFPSRSLSHRHGARCSSSAAPMPCHLSFRSASRRTSSSRNVAASGSSTTSGRPCAAAAAPMPGEMPILGMRIAIPISFDKRCVAASSRSLFDRDRSPSGSTAL